LLESNDTSPRDEGPPATTSVATSSPHFPKKPQKEQRQRRQKQNRQQQLLKRPCTCGRTRGWHDVPKSNRPSTKTIQNARGERITIEIERKYTPNPGPSEAYWAVNELVATLTTVQEMLPFVSKRYPSLLIRIADYAKVFKAITKIDRPWGDERFSKDSISWWLIALDASAYGYNAAASKNAIEVKRRTTNGKIKRIKLTPEYIRDKLHVAYEVAKDFVTYMPAYIEFREVWNYIVSNDKVVRAEFLRRLEQNKKSMLLQRRNNTAATTTNDSQAASGDSSYEYKYHYIMHYDAELYKQNKKTQGKVRCGPFTESEIRTFF
jgi:hypothetical protein